MNPKPRSSDFRLQSTEFGPHLSLSLSKPPAPAGQSCACIPLCIVAPPSCCPVELERPFLPRETEFIQWARADLSMSLAPQQRSSLDGVSVRAEGNQGNQVDVGSSHSSSRPYKTLGCRSFWQAGNFDATSTSYLPQEELEPSLFERARVHPKFLHSNATSHKWAFGAIAELLDNAVDEICNGATFVKVDKVCNPRDTSPTLLFHDDGGGMDPLGLRRCMSLGFSAKKASTMIGQYGNGFKTSTMRLGADVIVFTRANHGGRATQSVGLLSYTFLTRTMKDDIIIPIVDFEIVGGQAVPLIDSSQADWVDNLETILSWSPFSSEESLMKQFEDIGSHGTKAVIYNLWHDDDGLLELDFEDEDDDIKLRESAKRIHHAKVKSEIILSHISYTYCHSLRAYTSILYLREFTNFSIILRGKPVQQLDIASELKFSKQVTYRPHVGADSKAASVAITIGFAKEAPLLGIYGINVYHKNRLVMPFWKVFQDSSARGKCVLGFLEANFIEPAHDKQDFERTPLFIRLETRLKHLIVEYWTDHGHLIGYQKPDMRGVNRESGRQFNVKGSGLSRDMGSSECAMGLKANVHEPVMGFTENLQGEASVQPIIGVAAARGSTTLRPTQGAGSTSLEGSSRGVSEPVDVSDPTLVEKLRAENIQLFMRKNKLRSKEIELKQMVEMLEKELEDARTKCSKLESDLEIARKQQFSGH
ncbi:hypothetical protein Taro_039695 [Colocasia esculenta]|uniref:Morc S5 domain-containing protein n=1 Tax=Colocasia esculenta TaxID=4460 RepID=A0A843WMY9_COLES|nr:hypothetical protein [Colocasia esculenta]